MSACAQSSKHSDLSHPGTNPAPRSVALITEAGEGREHGDERLREKQTIMTALLREVIGDVLRRARTDQGRTLREVSDTARVSLGYLSEVERGRKEASSELLSAICGALDIPLSQVLSNAGEEMAREEVEAVTRVSAANIDATTKVVIPQVVSMAVA
jgi:transcriptional regulator with XRE-family HTH domain